MPADTPSTTASDAHQPRTVVPTRKRSRWGLLAGTLLAVMAFAIYFFGYRPYEAQLKAVGHLRTGLAAQERAEWPTVIREGEAATRLDPDNAGAWLMLGKAQRQQDGKGLPALQRAATLDPSNAEAQLEYGKALLDQGDTEKARKVLAVATKNAPQNVQAHKQLARAYLTRVTAPTDTDDGLKELWAVLEIEPGDVDARFRVGRTLYQANRLEEAGREFQECLNLLSDGAKESRDLMDGRDRNSAIWFTLVKGSHHYLQQIANRQGHAAEARHHGELFARMARYVEETDPLFRILKATPGDDQAFAKLGQVFKKYGFRPEGPNGAAAARVWIGP